MTRWLWTSADGLVTELSAWDAGNYVVADGRSGLLAPGYDLTTQELAGIDGAAVQQITAQAGAPTLGIDWTGSDAAELTARVRSLVHATRPRRGIGTLTAVADDGSTRRLSCYYRRGLESGVLRPNRFRAVLEFYAPSPWWRGAVLTYTWSLAAPSTFFPIFPLTLSPSTIAGTVTFDLSDTDAPTYPLWTITGPGSQLTLTNETTGRSLVLPVALGDGQTLKIDTRPGYQSVVRGDGTSLFGSLASDPALWPLEDGTNVVTALLANAGAASRIALTADRLYSGAL